MRRLAYFSVLPPLAVLALLTFTSPSLAREESCAQDVQRLCKDVKPGGGRIVKCLAEHEAELSEGCRALHQKVLERPRSARGACGADVEKLCKGLTRGAGQVVECLKEHEAELSPECKTALSARFGHQAK